MAKRPAKPTSDRASSKRAVKIILIVVGVLALLCILAAIVFGLLIGHIFKKAIDDGAITIKDGTISVKNDNGSEGSYSVGNQAKLPAGFPSDVPIYKPGDITFASHNGNNYSVTIASTDSPDKISAYYKAQLTKDGWQSSSNSKYRNNDLQSSGSSYHKGNRSLILTLTNSSNDNKTIIYLSISSS